MRRQRRAAEQWQALIDQQQASVLSAKAFCQEQNLGYASFCVWRKRLAGEAPESRNEADGAAFVGVSSLVGGPGAVR